MTKERRTVTVDASVDEYLSREGVNASQLVNKLVKEEMNGERMSEEVLRIRLDRIQDERESLETRVESKRMQEKRIEKQLEEQTEAKAEIIEEAREALWGTDLEPDNEAVKNWADKANMDVEAFISEVEEE